MPLESKSVTTYQKSLSKGGTTKDGIRKVYETVIGKYMEQIRKKRKKGKKRKRKEMKRTSTSND
ncbi:hypothetical protein D1B33_09745 [Lysinibacillus yapensis]|uniref:Uncharacterized protein n=1 Tax=Ureibacillus yapensis TaxID=2304605 RepID=A0A396S743_9BACL|nr:hypothetical protein D1B33_09745 [Lysinibacillus yapensis]